MGKLKGVKKRPGSHQKVKMPFIKEFENHLHDKYGGWDQQYFVQRGREIPPETRVKV